MAKRRKRPHRRREVSRETRPGTELHYELNPPPFGDPRAVAPFEPVTDPEEGRIGLYSLFWRQAGVVDTESFFIIAPCFLGFWVYPQQKKKLELEIDVRSHQTQHQNITHDEPGWSYLHDWKSLSWSVNVFFSNPEYSLMGLVETISTDQSSKPNWSYGDLQIDEYVWTHGYLGNIGGQGNLYTLQVTSAEKLTPGFLHYVEIVVTHEHLCVLVDANAYSWLASNWVIEDVRHNFD